MTVSGSSGTESDSPSPSAAVPPSPPVGPVSISTRRRRRKRLAVTVLIALVALLGWTGYQAGWDLWSRGQLREAQEAAGRHDWETGRTHITACLRGRPNDPAAHLLAARLARRLELLDEAHEHLETCRRLQGETQALKVERALLRVHEGDLAGAEEFLRGCVARNDPDAVEILDILSAALILHYRVIEASACLDDLLRREPRHFHALVRRAWTARSAGPDWFAQAVDYFDKALALRPDADNVRLALAEMQVAVGRFADAQRHFDALRGRQPNNPSVQFGLARALAGNGKTAEARPLLDRLLANHPNDWKALGERGRLALQDGAAAEAETDLRRAVFLAPPDLPLLNRMAHCLRLVNKPDEAHTFQDRADKLKADIQRAESLGARIREQSPYDPALRHELACILVRAGKRDDALHWFHTALEKDPRHRDTHQSLVEFHEWAGNFEQAARHRQALRQIDGAK